MTEEHKRKIGESNRTAHLGKKLSQVHKDSISKKLKGRVSPMKGKKSPHTEDTKKKIAQAKKTYYDRVGRISDIKKYLRTCREYRDWRKSVFERDGYRCTECEAFGVELNADHIIPFAIIISDFKSSTGLLNEELRDALVKHDPLWDTSNGRTLCVPCHRKTESFAVNHKYLAQMYVK